MTELPPIWLLSSPRSGSSMLAHGFSRSLGLGREPGEFLMEWLNPKHNERFRSGDIPKRCKVFPEQYREHVGDLDLGHVEEVWPDVRYIRLFRRDKVAQAVSLAVARMTKRWSSVSDLEPVQEYEDPPLEQVHLAWRQVVSQDRKWHNQLADRPHLTVAYEDLVADWEGELLKLIVWVDGDPAAEILDPPTRQFEYPDRERWCLEARAYILGRGYTP